jgi:serine phosphatase RsbU (regulator of sigma subunit)
MAAIPVASNLMRLHLDPTGIFGIPHLELFNTGYLFAGAFLSVMLVRRALAEWRQGTHLSIEFAAAREVQQRLIPAVLPRIDRFRIEAAYLPAQEVGGDFYQVLPQKDGATLIVIGDVSGKGLKAAMTGALVLGALRGLAQEVLSPSQVLTRLNDQLTISPDGGFITCLVLHIDPTGALALANAGHLPPYLNGHEVGLESGLPLGITAEAEYSETTLALSPGDSLTLLSDGVVEARNHAGELFGFDRAAAISTQPAESIAQAARQYGQEDDITVLTINRLPPVPGMVPAAALPTLASTTVKP